jgi:SnoaL-like domain
MQPWELDARESIRDLTIRYNSNGDSGRFAEVRKLFHDDAEMHIGAEAYIGVDEIMTIFTGTQHRVHAADGPPLIRHMTGTHQIDLVDGDNARGRLYFFVLTSIGPDHWGIYNDLYRRGPDGVWRFARRSVKLEGRSPNSLFTG